MPREFNGTGGAEAWFQFARSDLHLAKKGRVPGVLLEVLCAHAQQAAEKALKAVLVRRRTAFPKTRNLRDVLDLFPEDIPIPPNVEAAVILTRYAIAGRYPSLSIPVTDKEYRKALRMAEAVVRWAERAAG